MITSYPGPKQYLSHRSSR